MILFAWHVFGSSSAAVLEQLAGLAVRRTAATDRIDRADPLVPLVLFVAQPSALLTCAPARVT
jgi:hypothetical protein